MCPSLSIYKVINVGSEFYANFMDSNAGPTVYSVATIVAMSQHSTSLFVFRLCRGFVAIIFVVVSSFAFEMFVATKFMIVMTMLKC